jgi:hypothetical protein
MKRQHRYREAAALIKDEEERIREAAILLCTELGIEGDNTYVEQAKVFISALLLYHDRNQETKDAWKAVGFLGNLMSFHGKSLRLMNSLWWISNPEGRSEKPIDNALDGINYAAFFTRAYVADDERGNQSGGEAI